MSGLIDGDSVMELRTEEVYNVMPANESLNNLFAGITMPQNPGLAKNNWNSGHQDSSCSESVGLKGPTGKKLRLIKQYNPYGFSAIMACNKQNQFIGMAYKGIVFSLIVFDSDCHIIAATEVAKKTSRGFGGGYFYLNNDDNAVVVAGNSLACYPTANVIPSASLDPLWQTPDLVRVITKKLCDKNSLYGAMPVFTSQTSTPILYWVVLAGKYDETKKVLESNAHLAVFEIVPDSTKKDGCTCTLKDKVELENQWNNNTFAVSEMGIFFVTNGCDAAGTCTGGFVHSFGYDVATAKIKNNWSTSYENSGYLKPGQKNIGSGTTPTLLEAKDGTKLVAITDNAYPQMHVVVLNRETGKIVDQVPVFPKMRGCDEASLIGVNGRIVVENNFGHLPNYPHSQYVPNEPGIAMIQVNKEGGSEVVWENNLYPSGIFAMSMLARESGVIYAHTAEWNVPESSSKGGIYGVMAIDSWDGRVIWRIPLGQGRKYCHEYGGIYFNRTDTGIYFGTETYLVSIQNYED